MLFKSTENNAKSRSNSSGRPAPPSLLSLDLHITGNVASDGEVHVSGMVKGDINAKKLTIGEGGSVIGTVEAETVMVAGMLTGRLAATSVMLTQTARVVADITHVSLTIDQGAVFEGYSRRVDSIGQAEAVLPLSLPAARQTAAMPTKGGNGLHDPASASDAPARPA